jgi:phosphatidylinositol alpha-1,6-mannosyltransferase
VLLARKLRTAFFLNDLQRQINHHFQILVSSFQPDWVLFSVLKRTCCVPLPLARRMGISCAGIAYGSEVNLPDAAIAKWLPAILRQFERLIAISNYTRDRLVAFGVDSARISIVHPSVSVGLANGWQQQARGIAVSNFSSVRPLRLITICRLVERKGIQIVLQALAKVRKDFPDIEYHIVGDGLFLENLQALSKDLKLDSIVYFHGYLSEQARNQLLCDSDIFVMIPFETEFGDVEGFGIVYLEAGLLGKPVIASQSGGIVDAVKQRETGLVIAPADVAAAADAILELARDAEMRTRLGNAGNEWSLAHFPRRCGEALSIELNVLH